MQLEAQVLNIGKQIQHLVPDQRFGVFADKAAVARRAYGNSRALQLRVRLLQRIRVGRKRLGKSAHAWQLISRFQHA